MLRDLFSLFPAYAGVILAKAIGVQRLLPFPRIRGGDPHTEQRHKVKSFFSPHTRG